MSTSLRLHRTVFNSRLGSIALRSDGYHQSDLFPGYSLIAYHQRRHKHESQAPLKVVIYEKLRGPFNNGYEWTMKFYDRATGIDEIRGHQERVSQIQQEFVDATKKRRSCQDQIDSLKDNIKSLKDRMEATPRESETYVELVKEEYKLLREKITLEAQLTQLKQEEQLSFDRLSDLLKRSHELEVLRQQKSRFYQILSLFGSVICYFAFGRRQVSSFQSTLVEMDGSLQRQEKLQSQKFDSLVNGLEKLENNLRVLVAKVDHLNAIQRPKPKSDQSPKGWSSYVPGLSTLSALMRYIY